VQQELMSIPDFGEEDDQPFAKELKSIAQFKKAIMLTAGAAVQKLMMKLEQEQEILMHIADMAILTFNAESALMRVMKMAKAKGEAACATELDMMRIYLYDAADKIHKAGKDAVLAFMEGDEQMMLLVGLKRFTKTAPFNSKEARRRITAHLKNTGKYPL
jgi:hypothetical protein